MAGLTVQSFVSAVVGMGVAGALVRLRQGIQRPDRQLLGST